MMVDPLIEVGCSIVLQLAVLSDDGTATKTNALFLFWIAFRMTCVQVFNLSLPRKEIGYCNPRVLDVGWPSQLAPPLERLCSVCRALDSWLQADPQHVAVLHSRSVSQYICCVFKRYIELLFNWITTCEFCPTGPVCNAWELWLPPTANTRDCRVRQIRTNR